jgi:hypothetical protein
MAKRPHQYPAVLLGAERHWRGLTLAQRQQQAFRESPSAWAAPRYQVFTEDTRPHQMGRPWSRSW